MRIEWRGDCEYSARELFVSPQNDRYVRSMARKDIKKIVPEEATALEEQLQAVGADVDEFCRALKNEDYVDGDIADADIDEWHDRLMETWDKLAEAFTQATTVEGAGLTLTPEYHDPDYEDAIAFFAVEGVHLHRDERQATATVNRCLVSVRWFFGWLMEEGAIPTNPARKVKQLRRQALAPKGLDRAVVRRLLRELELRQDVRANAIFHVEITVVTILSTRYVSVGFAWGLDETAPPNRKRKTSQPNASHASQGCRQSVPAGAAGLW